MKSEFYNIVNKLKTNLFELKDCLLQDQDFLIKNDRVALEESNIKKLTLNQAIEAMLPQLHAHPSWNLLKNAQLNDTTVSQLAKIEPDLLVLWKEVDQTIMHIRQLLQTNHHVLTTNQAYYTKIYDCLLQTSTQDDNCTYNEKAEVT